MDEKKGVLILECAACAGPIYEGDPRVWPLCMASWMCEWCIPDMDPKMLKDEPTQKHVPPTWTPTCCKDDIVYLLLRCKTNPISN